MADRLATGLPRGRGCETGHRALSRRVRAAWPHAGLKAGGMIVPLDGDTR